MSNDSKLLIVDQIEPMIVSVRGHNVLLDRDLARIYGVPTKRLNEQIKRNRDRFPDDFMFMLTHEEVENLRSQFATSSPGHGGRRTRPYAFTEFGAIMAANILNSAQAIEVSVFVVRTFVKIRQVALDHKELGRKLTDLERKVDTHDESIRILLNAIRQLMAPPPLPSRGKIGFARENEK